MNKLIKLLLYIILSLGAFSMIFPFLWMILTSMMQNSQIFSFPPTFIPKPLILDNYEKVLGNMPILKYFYNSMFVAVVTTIGQVIIASMAGFAFAKMKFRFKEPLFVIILLTMMIPPQVNIVPLFFIMRELHMINTFGALILPGLFGGFGIFLMRQWFKSMPDELIDASKIDGCNYFEMFFKIAFPLSLPAIMTLAVFTFITMWNSFMWPLIVTNSDTIRTLPVAIAGLKGSYRETIEWGQLMACAVITTIPVILIFLAGQKYFINGIMQTGSKE